MFAKKWLKLLQISVLSLTTLESTMILSNVLRFVLDFQMISDIVCQVFLMSLLCWLNIIS